MTQSDKFNASLDFIKTGNKASFRRRAIIKQSNVRVEKPKKIEYEEVNKDEYGEFTVRPIRDDGKIVGIIHTCSCGRVSEIRFEFDE